MPSQVLYRKYRPKTFSEVIGQEHIVKTLTNAIAQNMVSHGYLFVGKHGCGKTTLARLVAKAVNCQNRPARTGYARGVAGGGEGRFEPCNKCQSCLEINQGNAIDLIEIDAASNRGIDEVRDLKEGIRFRPTNSKYKVFIIDEAHQLTKEAANALLKTLEEPPAHAIFILATTESHKMLPTIQSRCQRFNLRRLTVLEIAKRLESILKKEGIAHDKDALNLIAHQASGSVRDAETLLDEVVSFASKDKGITQEMVRVLLGAADKEIIFNFLNCLSQKQAQEAVEMLDKLIEEGIDLTEFVKDSIEYLRELLLFKIAPNIKSEFIAILSDSEKQNFDVLANSFTELVIKQAIESIMQTQNKMKTAIILQLPLELAIIDICQKTQ